MAGLIPPDRLSLYESLPELHGRSVRVLLPGDAIRKGQLLLLHKALNGLPSEVVWLDRLEGGCLELRLEDIRRVEAIDNWWWADGRPATLSSENNWLCQRDCRPMLAFLDEDGSDARRDVPVVHLNVRSCRLLAAAWGRRLASRLPRNAYYGNLWNALTMVVNLADGVREDAESCHARITRITQTLLAPVVDPQPRLLLLLLEWGTLSKPSVARFFPDGSLDALRSDGFYAETLRQMAGPLHRPWVPPPPWLCEAARPLALAAYGDRVSGKLRREGLGVLADFLEESGCVEDEVLKPLRGLRRLPWGGGWEPSPHQAVPGLWSLELLLGHLAPGVTP